MRITELEEEERLLQQADRRFWENPDHTPEAQMAYNRRREQIQKVRRELHDLQWEIAREMVRPAKR
jgi:hypothetical protein